MINMEKKVYLKPGCRYLIVDEESLMDVISGGTGEGTNNGANSKDSFNSDEQESAGTHKSVWDD